MTEHDGRPDAAAGHCAEIRADLKKRGTPIGANDLFIAAHARSLGLRLVTNNTAARRRTPSLCACESPEYFSARRSSSFE